MPALLGASDRLSWAKLRNLMRFAGKRLEEERLTQVAGSLTFTTVLALVPLFAIAFAIFTSFPLFSELRKSLEAYFIQSLMPKGIANTILAYLNQFAAKAVRLSAIGGILLVGTALAMIAMVDRTFNRIWRVRSSRPFARRLLVYWSTLTLGPLLIGVSITLTSYLSVATSTMVGATIPKAFFYSAISVMLTSVAFMFFYMVVPNRRVDWRDALCGALLAAAAFEIAKRLFAAFIGQFPTYTMVYGTLAAIPIFLIWIYLGWLIVLTGAVVAAALPTMKFERWWHSEAPGSQFIDAIALLSVLFEARQRGSGAAEADLIRLQTGLGYEEAERLLTRMAVVGWVGKVELGDGEAARARRPGIVDTESWTMVIAPEKLRLAQVFFLFAFDMDEETMLVRHVRQAVDDGLGQTLAEYFANGESVPA